MPNTQSMILLQDCEGTVYADFRAPLTHAEIALLLEIPGVYDVHLLKGDLAARISHNTFYSWEEVAPAIAHVLSGVLGIAPEDLVVWERFRGEPLERADWIADAVRALHPHNATAPQTVKVVLGEYIVELSLENGLLAVKVS